MRQNPKAAVPRTANVVERAIAHVGGSPAELARRIGEYAGRRISRQVVNGWRMRGIFPREVMIHVERLTGITVEEMVVAQPRPRDPGNIVDRAIRELGPDTNAAEFAQALTKTSGKRFTRQHVNGWQTLEQFPVEVTPWVHILTGIPIRELVQGREEQRVRRAERRRLNTAVR